MGERKGRKKERKKGEGRFGFTQTHIPEGKGGEDLPLFLIRLPGEGKRRETRQGERALKRRKEKGFPFSLSAKRFLVGGGKGKKKRGRKEDGEREEGSGDLFFIHLV